MPEHLRALVVILVLATGAFAFAKSAACATAMKRADFERRRNLWYGITLAAFLAHNYWIYIVAAAILLFVAYMREANKVAMFFFVLFAVPALSAQISGMGIMEHFFSIDYLRLLSLTVLLPTYLYVRKQPGVEPFGSLLPDKLLAGYLILQMVLIIAVTTFTNVLRIGVFYGFIDVFLPYYVASRALRNVEGFREAAMAFVVAALVLSPIGVFEYVRHWLLYFSLNSQLGVSWDMGHYLARGGRWGDLRAVGTTGQPIPFGYVMAVGIGFLIYLKKAVPRLGTWQLGLLILAAGLYASLSRGPWVCAAVMILVYAATSAEPVANVLKLGVFAAIVSAVLMMTPFGQKLVDLLPFIGTVNADSVTYRQQLWEVSTKIIFENPFFGGFDYFLRPEMLELKQGRGIIDVVNSYLAVALGSGFVGLAFFGGFFVAVAAPLFMAVKTMVDRKHELYSLGQGLFALIAGTLVLLGTVSSITVIPVIYWSLAGLGVGYVRMLAAAKERAAREPSRFQPTSLEASRFAQSGTR